MRLTALNRDGWCCRRCGLRGKLEVHHILAASTRAAAGTTSTTLQPFAAAVTSLSRQRTTGAS